MVNQFMKLRLSTRSSNSGFTLVELLVTTLISTIILGASLSLIVDQRKQFLTDQNRTQTSQNLRAGMDLIGTDIKLTGERLEEDFEQPGVMLIDASHANNTSDSDELILQRKLIPEKLGVCADVAAGATSIAVSTASGSGLCIFSSNETPTADGLTDLLNIFRDYRCEEDGAAGCARTTALTGSNCDGECTWAYIYNPSTNSGEFFQYAFEEADSTDPELNRIYLGGTATLASAYPAADNPEIYLLEEREYRLNGDVLELVVNRQDSDALRLINEVQNFEVTIQASGVSNSSFNPNSVPSTALNWQNIEHIEVELKTNNPSQSDLITLAEDKRTLTSRFFPRNIISK
ncbi:prepilin-type N-terminal cleavage/methylation domain-containing protein [Acaryochloris sp. CCMEE 5410]|nr:prepilin-type N-terminal cleavage/methylation domain-containing protein [Acaryochloris sp. CCMEE 5410]